MPLVFVHGVNVRSDPDYQEAVNVRDWYFRRFALSAIDSNPDKAMVLNPPWGDRFGARFAWNHASLPKADHIERFGPEDELPVLLLSHALGGKPLDSNKMLLDIARNSREGLEETIDLLWATSAESIGNDKRRAKALTQLAVDVANYAAHNQHPSWLNEVSNDREFLRRLTDELDDWSRSNKQTRPNCSAARELEVLGRSDAWDSIKEGYSRMASVASRLSSSALVRAKRASFHRMTARFLGDVLTYQNHRGTGSQPGAIVSFIMNHLKQAYEEIDEDDPKLIVVGHSMGGNIMYDILSHFLPNNYPNLHVDVFVTVGSQVAVFEELKLFMASNPEKPIDPRLNDRVAKPANIGHWINVFDLNDVLGFATEGVFTGCRDFKYATGKGVLKAHTAYFTLPSFHRRLAERLKELEL